jgi:hypothetical protein
MGATATSALFLIVIVILVAAAQLSADSRRNLQIAD